uniref:Uncharacterized protein n=1 Tax=Ficedula albicollis TaxID=59894 RepID=A0A803V6P2_FICAL
MSPAEEERSLPLPERWPRASKFALSACAAAVAELGTTHRGFPRGKGVKFTYGGQGEHQSPAASFLSVTLQQTCISLC